MSISRLTPEAQLLLLTAGGPQADETMLALLEREIDWSRLVWLAARENAIPVLWRRLEAVRPARLIPAEPAARLRKLAMVSAFDMGYLEDRLYQALDTLSAAGIEAILLKGAALAQSVYGSFVERPMADVDLLVRPEHADAARSLLLGVGWRWNSERATDQSYHGHHHLPPLADAGRTGVQLELHTALFFEGHPFRFPLDTVWEQSRLLHVRGRTVRVPDTLHLLLHVCLHFSWSHTLEEGAWRAVRDVHVLSTQTDVDWDAFRQLAVESRSATSCYWALRLATLIVGTPIPEAVLGTLRPRLPGVILRTLEQHYLLGLFPGEAGCPSVALRRLLWECGVRPAQSGHGTVRAWTHVAGATQSSGGAPARSVGQRLSGHARRLDGWVRYLRAVVPRSRSASGRSASSAFPVVIPAIPLSTPGIVAERDALSTANDLHRSIR